MSIFGIKDLLDSTTEKDKIEDIIKRKDTKTDYITLNPAEAPRTTTAKVIGVRALTEEEKRKYYGESYAEPSTAIVPVSQQGLLAQTEIMSLEARIKKIHIAEDEAKINADLLGKEKKNDEEAYKVDETEAIEAYKKAHKRLQRAVLYFKRGWKKYKPDTSIVVSERTELLDSIVKMQTFIAEGYKEFSEFPETIRKISENYGKFRARENELGQRLSELEALMQELPLDIQNGENHSRKLRDYAFLDEKEKAGLITELQIYSPTRAVPQLESAVVRKSLIEGIESAIAKKQLEAMQYGASKVLAAQELSSVKEQQAMIEEQMEELNKTWLPTLSRVELVKQHYDLTTSFTPAAMAALVMNRLREKSVPLIADAQASLQRAKKAVVQSRLNAEAAEEAEPEIQAIYAPATRECAAEETVEVLVGREGKELEAGR